MLMAGRQEGHPVVCERHFTCTSITA